MTTLKQLDALAEKITAMDDLVYRFDRDTEAYRAAYDALTYAADSDEESLKADESLRTLKFLYENTTVCQLLLARLNILTKDFVSQAIELIEAIEAMDDE